MRVTCPHCHLEFEVNVGKLIGGMTSAAKKRSSRLNGALGGQPKKKNPVRLRRWHEGHPDHENWRAEQERKKQLPPGQL